jgi:uncharacterized protein YggE
MLADDRVVVSGYAVREVVADRAEWRLQVHERGEQPRACFDACAARQAALVARLRETAEASGLTTGTIQLHREREYERPDPTYVASAEVVVVVEPQASGAVLASISEAGVDGLRGPRLVASGAEAVARDLLADAVADAQERAQRLAGAAGRALGRAVAIRERDEYRDYDDDDAVMAVSAKMSGGPEFDVVARPLSISARVLVSFELT